MRGLALLFCVIAGSAAAQQPAPPLPESARAESVPLYAAPTPAQSRYMQGLRTAGRGIAQLKDGVNRVTMSGRDSLRLRQAGRRLCRLGCAARGSMVTGPGWTQANA